MHQSVKLKNMLSSTNLKMEQANAISQVLKLLKMLFLNKSCHPVCLLVEYLNNLIYFFKLLEPIQHC